MSCGAVVALGNPTQPASTYEWLCTIPMAASAGGAVCSLYESSKNYNCVTQYAVGSVENYVKKAASTVTPVVQKLNRPIQAVDSYAASKLVNLGEKVPALKCEPMEVVTYLSESKESLATKITKGRSAMSTRLVDGKESLYSNISAGSEAVSNSRAGVLVGEVKQALNTRLVQGKETLGNGVAAGRDAVYSKIQSGAEFLSNTRAGAMVGAGVDCTLEATESWIEYLVPELENEKELFSELNKQEKRTSSLPLTRQPKEKALAADADYADADLDEEGEMRLTSSDECVVNRVERVHMISRRVKLRMYYRSMQRLQTMQHKCKATLQQLKDTVDLLKMAQAAHGGLEKQYQTVTSSLKDFEEQIRQLLSRQDATREIGFNWLPNDSEEEDNTIEWLAPKPQGTLQASLDYAKQLSKKVFHTFQSVSVATAYLPKQLNNGAGQSYQYAQEMYSTLKPIQTPMDLSASALKKITSLLETQLRYVTQLGTYLSSVLQKRGGTSEGLPSEDVSEDVSSSLDDSSELAESESADETDSVKN